MTDDFCTLIMCPFTNSCTVLQASASVFQDWKVVYVIETRPSDASSSEVIVVMQTSLGNSLMRQQYIYAKDLSMAGQQVI